MSFSAAARRLKMPISTVSRRVAELESQLGVRCWTAPRETCGSPKWAPSSLSTPGTAPAVRSVDDVISNRLSEVSGTLRVAAPRAFLTHSLRQWCVRSRLLSERARSRRITERIVDHIADDVDLAFKVGTFTDPSLVHAPIDYRTGVHPAIGD